MCCWPVPWLTLCFGNDWPVWELPASAASTSHSSTHVYLPSRIMQMTWGWKRRKTRLTMELIIYATFLVLSLIAYAARQVANKGEEKKVSVSNINFKRYLIPSGNKLSSFFPAFKRVFSSCTSSPCSVTGCKGLMFINSTPSTASRSRRSRSSTWPASHRAWFSGPVPGPSLISGEGGRWWGGFLFEKKQINLFFIF